MCGWWTKHVGAAISVTLGSGAVILPILQAYNIPVVKQMVSPQVRHPERSEGSLVDWL